MLGTAILSFFFFFNDTATTEIYTLSLHDALPISVLRSHFGELDEFFRLGVVARRIDERRRERSEEHTSELQSPCNLVCRLLLEKKKIERIWRSRKLNTITSTSIPRTYRE